MGRIIYDSRERLLYDEDEGKRIQEGKRTVRLSNCQGKLLMLLSDNEMHLNDELYKFIYDDISIGRIKEIRFYVYIYRFKKTIEDFKELKIENRFQKGYYMKGDLYIE